MIFRAVTDADLPLLAQMNKRLIEDEGHRNPMTVDQLEQRMRRWLSGDWDAEILIDDGKIVGYVLYQLRRDEYAADCPTVYIRHFYIEREQRRHGLGRQAIQALCQTRFPAHCTVAIDVLTDNTVGCQFWSSLGFEPYSMTMKLRHP